MRGSPGPHLKEHTALPPGYASSPMLLSSGQVAPCASEGCGAPSPSLQVRAPQTMSGAVHGDGLGAACSAQYLSPCHGCPRARTLPWIYIAPSDHRHPLSGEERGLGSEMGGSTYCPGEVPAPAAEIEGRVVTSGKKSEVCTAELAGSNWPSLYPVLWPTL